MALGSVVRCLSYSSWILRSFNAPSRWSASCLLLIRASSSIATNVHTAVLSGIVITSFTLANKSCCPFWAIARCLLNSFQSKVSCSDSSSSFGRKILSASATSVRRLTSIGDVSLSSRNFSWTFALGVISNLVRTSAAVFYEPARCMIRKLNSKT